MRAGWPGWVDARGQPPSLHLLSFESDCLWLPRPTGPPHNITTRPNIEPRTAANQPDAVFISRLAIIGSQTQQGGAQAARTLRHSESRRGARRGKQNKQSRASKQQSNCELRRASSTRVHSKRGPPRMIPNGGCGTAISSWPLDPDPPPDVREFASASPGLPKQAASQAGQAQAARPTAGVSVAALSQLAV
ncbi:uncharacterized protein PSFLO_06563 [Pseudozyma flocculosa]|uniref:Uncharacterized protein n=1 Tax=Pseudozyma flocculosa TaxID=84751 RepID=A0A5C3FCA3_9BASI|nr:uncharacterized protein PSFLO_06563 [Pseudozyma flocculosa]